MKGFMAVLFFVALFSLMCAQAERIKWEMTNIYPKTSSELQAWTNEVPNVGTVDLLAEMVETKRRIDILWTDYTNRLERIAQMREKRRVAEEKKAARSRAFEIRKKYRAKERSK